MVPLAASRTKDVAFILIGAASALSLGETIVYEVGMVGRQNGFSEDEIDQMKAIRGIYNDAIMTNEGWDLLRKAIEESITRRFVSKLMSQESIDRSHIDADPATARRLLRYHVREREIGGFHSNDASIAVAAGFSDQAHFSRTFRVHTGLTPAKFRAAFRVKGQTQD